MPDQPGSAPGIGDKIHYNVPFLVQEPFDIDSEQGKKLKSWMEYWGFPEFTDKKTKITSDSWFDYLLEQTKRRSLSANQREMVNRTLSAINKAECSRAVVSPYWNSIPHIPIRCHHSHGVYAGCSTRESIHFIVICGILATSLTLLWLTLKNTKSNIGVLYGTLFVITLAIGVSGLTSERPINRSLRF